MKRSSLPIRCIAGIIGWTVQCIALPLLDVARVALFDVLLDRAALFNVLLALHRPLLHPTLAMTTSGGPLAKGGSSVSTMGLCMYMFMCMRGAAVKVLAKTIRVSLLSSATLFNMAGALMFVKGGARIFELLAKRMLLAKSLCINCLSRALITAGAVMLAKGARLKKSCH